MIWAATMGLPLSLEGVGAVLGLEKQKLSEGKDLIKYFCQPCAPTKANGQRTRNHPFHTPDKWAMFKKYNIRDVDYAVMEAVKFKHTTSEYGLTFTCRSGMDGLYCCSIRPGI